MSTWSDDTQAAWELYAAELAKLPGVITVETGRRTRKGRPTREPAVVVTVARKLTPDQLTDSTMVPKELRLPDGSVVGTDVVEDPAGVYTVDQDSATYRPVPGGCEIGPIGSAFLGTLGGWFCAPRRGGGWNPVWLTNAHVANPVNFATIPADARMLQPAGGGVIGRTTAMSGWPQPLPATGVTVGGVTDASIGVLDSGVNPDYQVLQIAPAPFEIGTAAGGMGVQKRGRTTLLRNGTVDTAAGGGPFLSANIGSPAGGQVTFGLPGQPRLFRISSPGTGIGVAFGMPGDSGSLVFSRTAGRLRGTFPCVGLYFAGNGRWVSQQSNPNMFTVVGFAFDITNVMAQFNLETVCTCIVRSILDAIFGRDPSIERIAFESPVLERVPRAESMMRHFRNDVLERSSAGKVISEAIEQTAPDISRVLALDPIAFGLAVDLLEPWAKASTSLAVLRRPLDAQTVSTATELVERIARLAPETEERLKPLLAGLQQSEGEPVRKLIGNYRPPTIPKVDRARSTRRRKR
jgi:hypothetical protein